MAAMRCRARTSGRDRAGDLCPSVPFGGAASGSRSPSSPRSSAFASSTGAGYSLRSSAFFHRSSSPTRVKLLGRSSPPPASSIRFSIDRRSASPGRSLAVGSPRRYVDRDRRRQVGRSAAVAAAAGAGQKRTCMCSPTTHPGSFRCSLHREGFRGRHAAGASSSRLNARRSAMSNSLVRIGTVEGGEWVRRALTALIRPSSHQQRRRAAFQPRPSRLSIMSKADDL